MTIFKRKLPGAPRGSARAGWIRCGIPDSVSKVVILSEIFDVTTDYLLKGIEPVETTDHKTMADVVDQKILTEKNGKRAKSILKWVLIVLGAFLAIDFISMLIYFLVNGFPT